MALPDFQRHIKSLENIKDPRVEAAREFLIKVEDRLEALEANANTQTSIVNTIALNVKDVAVRTMLLSQVEAAKEKVRDNFTRIKDEANAKVRADNISPVIDNPRNPRGV